MKHSYLGHEIHTVAQPTGVTSYDIFDPAGAACGVGVESLSDAFALVNAAVLNKGNSEALASAEAATAVITRTTASWEVWFELLEAFNTEYGFSNVSVNWRIAGGEELGCWLSTQRSASRNGTLSVEHRSKLESLGVWLNII